MCEPEREGQRRCSTPWMRKVGKLVNTGKEKTELLLFPPPPQSSLVTSILKILFRGSPHQEKGKCCTHFLKKGRSWDLLLFQSHLHAQEDCGTDHIRSCAEAHGSQGGNSRQFYRTIFTKGKSHLTNPVAFYHIFLSGQGKSY